MYTFLPWILFVCILGVAEVYGRTQELHSQGELWTYWVLGGVGILLGVFLSAVCAGCAKKPAASKAHDTEDLESGIHENSHTYYNVDATENNRSPPKLNSGSFIKRIELDNGDVYALPVKKPTGHKGTQKPAVAPKPKAVAPKSPDDGGGSSDDEDDMHMYDSIDPLTDPAPPAGKSPAAVGVAPKAVATEEEEERKLEDTKDTYRDPTVIPEVSTKELSAKEASTSSTTKSSAKSSGTDKPVKGNKKKPKAKAKVKAGGRSVESGSKSGSGSGSKANNQAGHHASEDGQEYDEISPVEPVEPVKSAPASKVKDNKVSGSASGSQSKATAVDPADVAVEEEGELEDVYNIYVPDDPSVIQEAERYGSRSVTQTVLLEAETLMKEKTAPKEKTSPKEKMPPKEKTSRKEKTPLGDPKQKKSLEGEKHSVKITNQESVEESNLKKDKKTSKVKAKPEKTHKRKTPQKEVATSEEPTVEHEYYNIAAFQASIPSSSHAPPQPKPIENPAKNGRSSSSSSSNPVTAKTSDAKSKQDEKKAKKDADKDKAKKDADKDKAKKDVDKDKAKKSQQKDVKKASNKSNDKSVPSGGSKKTPQMTIATSSDQAETEQDGEDPLYDYASIGQVASLTLPTDHRPSSGQGGGQEHDEISPMDPGVQQQEVHTLDDIGLEIVENDLYDTRP